MRTVLATEVNIGDTIVITNYGQLSRKLKVLSIDKDIHSNYITFVGPSISCKNETYNVDIATYRKDSHIIKAAN